MTRLLVAVVFALAVVAGLATQASAATPGVSVHYSRGCYGRQTWKFAVYVHNGTAEPQTFDTEAGPVVVPVGGFAPFQVSRPLDAAKAVVVVAGRPLVVNAPARCHGAADGLVPLLLGVLSATG